jgi:hypothetical protein
MVKWRNDLNLIERFRFKESDERRLKMRTFTHKPKANAAGGERFYEQEADRVAGKVMQSSGQEQIRTRPARQHDAGETAIPPTVRKVISATGQPMDPATRTFFEPRFGRDFSQVRVHTGPTAAESAKEMNALAYTVGNHVVFGQQNVTPGTREGLHLQAHELAHVVQQEAHHGAFIQRQPSPDSTNYTFDTYRVTESDLSDPDIVSRFKMLSIEQLIRYLNRVSDVAVIEFIDKLLYDRLSSKTPDQLFEHKAKEKDPAVRNYIDQWVETHIPTSYEIAEGKNKPGETETAMKISRVSVTVLPDEYLDQAEFDALVAKVAQGKVSDVTKAITVIDPKWQPRYVIRSDKVSSIRPTVQELKIKTVYLRGTSRTEESAYGVGTREEDEEKGRTTVAHHEGTHATCFIQYLRDNAPPSFTGNVGDTETRIQNKDEEFQTAMKQYYADMKTHCGPSIDCAGDKASFCTP